MYKLSCILIFLTVSLMAQVPHGKDFSLDCDICHTPEGWQVDQSKVSFDHSETNFELMGQHQSVGCRNCHESLVFKNVGNSCFECHSDIHETTLGKECETCHGFNSWVVTNIKEIHDLNRFPLIGNHAMADCEDCHASVSNLRFEPLGVRCYDCHNADYAATLSPNHTESGFSTDCEECHSLTSSEWSLAAFAHDFFPLLGGHQLSNCFECHDQNTFAGLSTDCYQCHQTDYENADAVDHVANSFETDCSVCHTLNPGWSPALFNNHDDIYPLIGAHAVIAADCNQCHSSGYANTPTECFGCHESDYNATTNPSHTSLNFSTNCIDCHGQNAWTPATFDHDAEFFPIYSGEHNGEWNACSDCHTDANNYAVFSCIDCHEHNKTDMDEEHGGVNGYLYESNACLSCHPTGSEGDGFNHSTTIFPLTGSHNSVDCQDCHTTGYQGTSTLCDDCHHESYLTAPDHSTLGYPTDCEQCHSTNIWSEANFDHNSTSLPLTGAHIGQNCGDCHSAGFAGTSAICSDCHMEQFNATSDPNHQTLSIPTQCDDCHTTDPGWKPAQFPIHDDFFVLLGAHLSVTNCSDCHTVDYNNTPNQCFGCHETDYNATTDPAHQSAGFTTDCETCHSETAWSPATFNHDAQYFPIYSGEHNGEWSACSDCHSNQSNFADFTCIDCHEHNQADTDDEHQGVDGYAYISQECFASHPDGSGEGAFNHANSNFPLTGAHTTALCEDCHSDGYLGTSSLCYDCHNDVYTSSQNPSHQTLVLSQVCEECHNTDAWTPSIFDHSASGFELINGHQITDCSSCHTKDVTATSNLCYDCHQENYTAAPDHSNLGYPMDCEQCHSTINWQETSFDHNNTDFPLTGAHVSQTCESCHSEGFSGTSNLCYDCHTEDYSTAPDHSSLSYPVDCQQCHNTTNWAEASFDHNNTNFPLTGAHIGQGCAECHSEGFTGTSTVCYDCHTSDFNSTTNPDHQNLGLATQCNECHTTNAGWSPAEFPVHDNFYQLLGAHASIQNNCNDCHNGDYNNTPNTCYQCHQSDYNATTDPSHSAAQFPTDCEQCHSQSAWEPSTFNHDGQYFPIYSGEHRNEWNSCSDCHTNASNYSIFSCIDCHEHNQSEMDSEHDDVSGYIYDSNACYDCHPDGEGDDIINPKPKNREI